MTMFDILVFSRSNAILSQYSAAAAIDMCECETTNCRNNNSTTNFTNIAFAQAEEENEAKHKIVLVHWSCD